MLCKQAKDLEMLVDLAEGRGPLSYRYAVLVLITYDDDDDADDDDDDSW